MTISKKCEAALFIDSLQSQLGWVRDLVVF